MGTVNLKAKLENECEPYILTKKSEKVYPEAVEVFVNAYDVKLDDGALSARLIFGKDDETKPYIILDMGTGGCGGYPVFTVGEFSENAIVRLSYADKYENIIDEKYGETGDFTRGSCKYLGVELPVMPANPYRYEKYTVTESGVYFSPLIQGQQRFVRIQLDTPDSYVEINGFYFINTTDVSPHDGYFLCDNENFNRLWYSSTYTVQMASIKNSNAWEIVEGWLAPRKLTKANDVGLCRQGADWRDYCFSCDFKIITNPEIASGAGVAFRAADENNCYVVLVDSWSRLYIKRRENGVYSNLFESQLPFALSCNKTYQLALRVSGSTVEVLIDGTSVALLEGIDRPCGTVGFCQPTDKWAVFNHVRVENNQGLLFADDFENGLDAWDYRKTLPFVADGGKRDRLPWSGDLDWAGRNSYYAFKDTSYMRGALDMLAFHQTPDGYVQATCYPEDIEKPCFGDYGYYQSDLFSMWNAVAAADYILFTADMDFAAGIYPCIQKNMDYLYNYVEADGLFCQRYETSKGLWSHDLEQIGKFSYHNVLLYDACREAAFIARFMSDESAAIEYERRAELVRQGIRQHLFHEQGGYLQVSEIDRSPCFMANAMALTAGVCADSTDEERIFAYLDTEEFNVGKIVSLAIRGFYNINRDTAAYDRMIHPGGGVDWLAAIYDRRFPATVWECMVYHREEEMLMGDNWADYSHPDSGLAHILTGYILGIQPVEAGFKHFAYKPHCHGFGHVAGVVPTVNGDISCEWKKTDDGFSAVLEFPEAMTADIYVPLPEDGAEASVILDGKEVYRSAEGFAGGIPGETEPGYAVFHQVAGGSHTILFHAARVALYS